MDESKRAFDQNLGWCLSSTTKIRNTGSNAFQGSLCESTKCGVAIEGSCPQPFDWTQVSHLEQENCRLIGQAELRKKCLDLETELRDYMDARGPAPSPAQTPVDCSDGGRGRRGSDRASESVVIVVCVAAATVLLAGLYVRNKVAQAKKQPHRDSSMPAVGEDVEGVADASAN